MTNEERQSYFDLLAESIASTLCECNHSLLFTGPGPDELLECAMQTFYKKVPGFQDAPETVIQDFADRLGVALCDQMLVEHDLLILKQRGGMRPS
jgi:hypothetical protein